MRELSSIQLQMHRGALVAANCPTQDDEQIQTTFVGKKTSLLFKKYDLPIFMKNQYCYSSML
jgi:hypothetical protein